MSSLVEFRIKSDVLADSQKEFINYKKESAKTRKKIFEVNSRIKSIESKIFDVKFCLEKYEKTRPDEESDYLIVSPKNLKKITVNINPYTNGTASGGILSAISDEKIHKGLISGIGISNDDCYYETPAKTEKYDDSFVLYENSYEKIGCNKFKYFCF